jgi:hypothetical protein
MLGHTESRVIKSIAAAKGESQKVNWPINLPLKAQVWEILRLFKDHTLQIVNIYLWKSSLIQCALFI